MMRIAIFISLILILISCGTEPRDIHYGLDTCEYCHMSISDHRYGTEIVTKKGKIYTFDSIECMIDFTKESGVETVSQHVTSILEPGKLIDASNVFVIKCKAIPSPMGRYLTAFPNKEEAEKIQAEKGGEVLPWKEAFNKF